MIAGKVEDQVPAEHLEHTIVVEEVAETAWYCPKGQVGKTLLQVLLSNRK